MKPITIAGGGLAGLALGIGLRRASVPVTIWEASHYPRHKVCGEFICGQGLRTLDRLGLTGQLVQAGGRWARDAAFYCNRRPPACLTLPQPALCLSRHTLDRLLADEFRRAGGELRERQRWSGDFNAPGVVRATGHRVTPTVAGWRWFGLKAHARGVALAAGLELHLVDDGYIGVCRLADAVNVCGLFRCRQPIQHLRQRWQEMLARALRGRSAEWLEESFSVVAGLCVEPRAFDADAQCQVGDALTMIPPATGNGMSMALEAAELAVEPLARCCRGETAWPDARRQIATACHHRFAVRLRAAKHLHELMFVPWGQKLLAHAARFAPGTLRLLFTFTR